METHSESTRRIARNTLMLYVRMLFGMLVSLYTSRVILNALGIEDYGIYSAVGGFVGMFSIISSSLSSAVSRFLTFELGKGNIGRLRNVFSTSLSIHAALAVAVLIVAETVGVWLLNTKMTIPADRVTAANCVFQASLLSFSISTLCVPFNASIVSHERMKAFAYIGILDVMLKLLIVLFIAYSGLGFDRLIVYSLLLVAVSLMFNGIYLIYCRRHFEECRLRFSFDRKYLKEIGSFAGWNFIGCTAATLKTSGIDMLLNMFCGPVINAAKGIAGSVNSAVSQFAGNFMTALNPQITKSYASGDREYMLSLVEKGSRFSFYILFILALPVILETDYILALWLKQYPEHAVNFVRLVLLLSMVDILSGTLITLQCATGNIRNYQLAVGGMLLLNFPLSYACLRAGMPPESTMWVAVFIAVLCLFMRLAFLRKMAGLPMFGYIRKVCVNVLSVALVAVVLPAAVHLIMEAGGGRFLAVGLVSVMSSATSVLYVGCSASERKVIFRRIAQIMDKFLE